MAEAGEIGCELERVALAGPVSATREIGEPGGRAVTRACEVLLLSILFTLPARAGVNDGGVLVAHDAGLIFTGDITCGQGTAPSSCTAIDTRIDGAHDGATAAVWKIYAAFPPGSSPRLSGITWGIHYSPSLLILAQDGCGDLEISDPGWPGSDLGTVQTWSSPQTSILTPVYSFAGYTYAPPSSFTLRAHPNSGGWFWDNSAPTVEDPIRGFGAIGFDQPGTLICASTGACCDSVGVCAVVDSTGCVNSRREFRGTGSTCSPNPCEQPGTCCIGYGDCVFVAEPWCIPIPGIFFPGGLPGDCSTCLPTESGYCCLSTTCVAVDWITCALQEGLFQASSWPEPCLPNPCYSIGVGDERPDLSEVSLEPPVPNPSRGAIQYGITLPRPGQVHVFLLDVTGRLVLDLPERQIPAGRHTFSWDLVEHNGLRIPSGIYTLRLDVTSTAPASARGSVDGASDVRRHESRMRRVTLLR